MKPQVKNPYTDRDVAQVVAMQQEPLAIAPGQDVQQFAKGKAAANTETPQVVVEKPYNMFTSYMNPVENPNIPKQPTSQPAGAPVRQTGAGIPQTIPAVDGNSPSSGMDALISMYTSPQKEEELRKSSQQRQRIMAVADALRHIGNIYNTTKGAPSQRFNMPAEQERQRYLQEKGLRDMNNYKFMTYQQAKAAQEAKLRQFEADYGLKVAEAARKAGYTDAQIKNLEDRLTEQKRMNNLNYDLNQDRLKYQKERGERQDKERERHNKASEARGWAALKETKRHHGVIEEREGRNSNNVTLRGKNGFYSKKMGNSELNSFYNQTYNEMKRRGLIDEKKVLAGLPADIYGQKSVSQSAMKNAVDDALLRHPEVGSWLADEYEFDFDPRYEEEEEAQPITRYKPFPFESPKEHDWSRKQEDEDYYFGFGDMSGVHI